jgi:hypothetical protein
MSTQTFLITYLILGILAAIYSFGTTFAYFQKIYGGVLAEKDRLEDYGFSAFLAIYCIILPLMFIVPLFGSGFNRYGRRIK